MLFIIFNALMVGCLVLALFHGWRYWDDKQEHAISAFIAVISGSVFSFYVIALGITTAGSALLEGFRLSVSAVKALFTHL
jgi:hypothetical protein